MNLTRVAEVHAVADDVKLIKACVRGWAGGDGIGDEVSAADVLRAVDRIEFCLSFGLEEREPDPVPMLLWCPECGERHIDRGEFTTKAHHTHACQDCGMTWRPAVVPTVGVRFLPGFKNEELEGGEG